MYSSHSTAAQNVCVLPLMIRPNTYSHLLYFLLLPSPLLPSSLLFSSSSSSPQGTQQMTGVVVAGEKEHTFSAVNDVKNRQFFWIELPTIAGIVGLPTDLEYVLASYYTCIYPYTPVLPYFTPMYTPLYMYTHHIYTI